ncbi:MAG: LysR family transcriptional regulator [Burkholderiaceae bacterium]|nr:LysR family transcriptional regulator [Burkholderiaceae bacterium]
MKHYPSLKRLQQFQHLARTLNFRRSAEELNIAQPALSRSIRLLEDELGFSLFTRSTRSTTITAAGEHLLNQLGTLFGGLEQTLREARRIASHQTKRKLKIGYSAQAANGAMPSLLFSFGGHHTDVELGLLQAPSEELYMSVRAGTLDAAFLLGPAQHGEDAELECLHVDRQPLVALCAARHALAKRQEVSLAELQKYGLIIGSPSRWGIFRDLLDIIFQRHQITPHIVYEPDDTPILLESVARSDNIALYGNGIIDKLPPGIVAIPLQEADASLDIYFLWRRTANDPLAALETFIRNRTSTPERPTNML